MQNGMGVRYISTPALMEEISWGREVERWVNISRLDGIISRRQIGSMRYTCGGTGLFKSDQGL